jgi:hypothetical protein
MEACAQDLGKPRFEAGVAESGWLLNDIVYTTRNLHKWAKDEKAPEIDLTFKFMNPKIRKDPLGCVLVIGYAHILPRAPPENTPKLTRPFFQCLQLPLPADSWPRHWCYRCWKYGSDQA